MARVRFRVVYKPRGIVILCKTSARTRCRVRRSSRSGYALDCLETNYCNAKSPLPSILLSACPSWTDCCSRYDMCRDFKAEAMGDSQEPARARAEEKNRLAVDDGEENYSTSRAGWTVTIPHTTRSMFSPYLVSVVVPLELISRSPVFRTLLPYYLPCCPSHYSIPIPSPCTNTPPFQACC